MMRDLTGETFGRLTVVERRGKNKHGKYLWLCRCSCGVMKIVTGNNLKSGNSSSCGCYTIERIKSSKITHGRTETKLYVVWCGMKARCYNPNEPQYADWGGRGITVCEEWKNSFETFFKDMGDVPFDGATIDRIDNDKGYCLENCRWATRRTQANNTRTNRMIQFDGREMTVTQWAREVGINQQTLDGRIRCLGWSPAKALTTPVRPMRTQRKQVN